MGVYLMAWMIVFYIVAGLIALFGLNWGLSSVGNLFQILINGAPQLIGLAMAIAGIYYMITLKDKKWQGIILMLFGVFIAMGTQFFPILQIIMQNWIVLLIGLGMVFVFVLKKEGILE